MRDDLLLSGGDDGVIQAWPTSENRLVHLAEARLPRVVKAAGAGNDWLFLLNIGRFDEACTKARSLVESATQDRSSHRLWWIATVIADTLDEVRQRHDGLLTLAELAIQTAIEIAEKPDGFLYSTLARVWCVKGDLQQAVAWQTKAFEVTPEYRVGDRQLHAERLEEFRKRAAGGR
ncbi:MAG: hypothetical protein WBO45_06085 [Planctomycetota bacterium]